MLLIKREDGGLPRKRLCVGRKLIPAVNRSPEPELAIVEINPRTLRLIGTDIGLWHRETLDE